MVEDESISDRRVVEELLNFLEVVTARVDRAVCGDLRRSGSLDRSLRLKNPSPGNG